MSDLEAENISDHGGRPPAEHDAQSQKSVPVPSLNIALNYVHTDSDSPTKTDQRALSCRKSSFDILVQLLQEQRDWNSTLLKQQGEVTRTFTRAWANHRDKADLSTTHMQNLSRDYKMSYRRSTIDKRLLVSTCLFNSL